MAAIFGLITDAAGDPVPHARVYYESGPVALPDVAALSGADGRFALGAPAPGEYVVAANGGENLTGRARVTVAGKDVRVHIHLGRGG